MLTRIGYLTVGQFLPITLEAFAFVEGVFGAPGGIRAGFQLELDAALRLMAAISITPPDLHLMIDGIANLSGRLSAAIGAGVTPPGLSLDVGAVAKSIASLTATIGRLEANIAYAATLTSLLATGNVRAYALSGAGGIAPAPYAIVAVAHTPEAWRALTTLLVIPNGYVEAPLSALLPTTSSAIATIDPAISKRLLTLTPRLAGLLSMGVSLGLQLPSLNLWLSVVTELSIRLGLMLAGGITLPGIGVSLELSGYLDLIALLELEIYGIDVILRMIANLMIDLGVGGLDVYSYEGPPSDLSDLFVGDTIRAVALTTNLPETWSALQNVLF